MRRAGTRPRAPAALALALASLMFCNASLPGALAAQTARLELDYGGVYGGLRQWPLFLAPPGGGGGGAGAVPVVVFPVSVTSPLAPIYRPDQIACPPTKECSCVASTTNMDSSEKVEEQAPSDIPEEEEWAPPPRLEPVSSSQRLVDEFRAQTPRAPGLPPMSLSGGDASARARIPDGGGTLVQESQMKTSSVRAGRTGPAPGEYGYRSARTTTSAPPRYHADSVRTLRGQVTAHRADYTEPYTVWFDEKSGNSRVDFHGGSASTFRMATPAGGTRRTTVWMQRSGPRDVWRCATADVSPDASAPSGRHPALPDLTEFTFSDTEDTPEGPVEVWQRMVQGRPGEQGAARGEVLTTRHEMRLMRVDGDALPLRYTVAVDSSALGSDCDGYEHVYRSDSSQPISSKFFNTNFDKLCDVVENLDALSAEDVAKLEPLREFTLPHRDLRHDQLFDKFQTQFARQYKDEREEAVRKNVLMQNTRFVASGNRQGATSELGVTHLADRLRAEVSRMTGARGPPAELAAGAGRDSFPYSRDEVLAEDRRLPSKFDWRALGAVSPVGCFNCSSCWAFAVSGAVEGALFRRTRRLVPLSYQCLVDCAHPFGGNGCTGTWPSHAYDYVRDRGLPALDEYPPYKEKVDRCVEQRVPSQTRISGHINVTTNSVPALKVAIRKHAPTVVIVDAECQSFIMHKKGVLYDDRCGKELRQLHHAVLAVGWGERDGEPHFILKNSWSQKWGAKGYIRIHARSNTCGVLTMPSYPLLEDGDVRQPLRPGRDNDDLN